MKRGSGKLREPPHATEDAGPPREACATVDARPHRRADPRARREEQLPAQRACARVADAHAAGRSWQARGPVESAEGRTQEAWAAEMSFGNRSASAGACPVGQLLGKREWPRRGFRRELRLAGEGVCVSIRNPCAAWPDVS